MKILITVLFVITVFLVIVAIYEKVGEAGVDKRLDQVNGKVDPNAAKSAKESQEAEEKKGLLKKLKNNNFIKNYQQKQNDRKQQFTREKAKRERANEKESATELLLDMAGVDMTPEQFSMVKVMVAVIGLIVAFLVTRLLALEPIVTVLVIAFAGLICMIAPTRLLRMKIDNKKKKIRDQLPDVMDLLVVSVEAGLGFDAALVRLYEKNQNEVMEELMSASRDIKRGVSKKEAYNNVAKRNDVKELTSFLTAMIQADQMGISVRSILIVQAETLREKRRQRAEEKAMKAPVKMMLPLVVFIFPVIFIILLGPAGMTIMENLSF